MHIQQLSSHLALHNQPTSSSSSTVQPSYRGVNLMGDPKMVVVALLMLCLAGAATASWGPFILDKSEQVVRTDGGEVRIVKGFRPWEQPKPMSIAFFNMEPKTLFVPQYLDSSLVFFIRSGEARIGWIFNDDLVEKTMKQGDVNRIPAGSTFYIVNTGNGQRLQIIAAVASESPSFVGSYQSFFIGGGVYPPSVLAGFDKITLAMAYNATVEEVSEVFEKSYGGPIVSYTDKAAEEMPERAAMMHERMRWGDNDCDDKGEKKWSWRKLLNSMVGGENDRGSTGKKGDVVIAPDSYNLYKINPGYKNKYGWSVSVDETEYKPLESSGVGVYLVYLTAGAMMAIHVNPIADEYGFVLSGSATIKIANPNGTAAMDAEVHEGDGFLIPRYFPFCHIASRSGPVVFFGFTTSAKRNRPQFLAGKKSVLTSMMGPELAAGFGTTEEKLRKFVELQEFDVFLPPWPPAEERKGREESPVLIKTKVAM